MFRLLTLEFITLLLLCFCFGSNAFALDIKVAKAKGLVGESSNGYIGAVSSSPSGEVKALVADVNSKRKATYMDIAKKNGTELSVVEKLAGKKAYAKSPKGTYLEQADGKWKKKQ